MTAISSPHRLPRFLAWLLWVLPLAWLAGPGPIASVCWAQQSPDTQDDQGEQDEQSAEQDDAEGQDDPEASEENEEEDAAAEPEEDDPDAAQDDDPDTADQDDDAQDAQPAEDPDQEEAVDTDGSDDADDGPDDADDGSDDADDGPDDADDGPDDADDGPVKPAVKKIGRTLPPGRAKKLRDEADRQAEDDRLGEDEENARALGDPDDEPTPAKKPTAKVLRDARRKRMADLAKKRNEARKRKRDRTAGRPPRASSNKSRRDRLSTKTGVARPEALPPEVTPDDDGEADEEGRPQDRKPSKRLGGSRTATPLDKKTPTQRTPRDRANSRKIDRKKITGRDADKTDPADLGEPPPVVEIDVEPTQFDIPPEARTYQFSFEDVDYDQLLNAFSRMSGLAIIGDPPPGKVTFKTTEVMDFETALSRVKLLLFKHRDNYWLVRDESILEVTRMNDIIRDVLKPEDIYPNVSVFRAANRDPNDLAMLLYSPEKGSIEDLTEIRDFLPDYVRSAPVGDVEKNAMYIFALVRDINKFLDLVDLFRQAGADPRIIKPIPVVNISPTEAIQALGELMDLTPAPTVRRSTKRGATAPARAREIKLFPDDAQQVIIVRALPSDIEEIERLLPFVDVDPGDEFTPTIIALKYLTAEEIMGQLTPLLAAPTTDTKSRAKKPPRRRTTRGKTTPVRSTTTGDVTVVPEPRTNTLIVVGSAKGVARVRQIVAILDVPGNGREPQFVKLEFAEAVETAAWVEQMVSQINPVDGSRPFSATPDERDNTIILVGNPIDVQQALKLIGQKDRKGAKPDLHKHRLTHALPSEVAAMLTRLDAQSSGRAAPPIRKPTRKKGTKVVRPKPRRGNQASGKFIGDDDRRMIYVICTDDEWQDDYLPRIVELDEDAKDVPLSKHRIELAQGDPVETIELLTRVLGADGTELPVMTALNKAILIVDATPIQLERIEALVTELDIDPGLERKIIALVYADPNDVRDIVMTMVATSPVRKTPVGGSSRKPKGKKRRPVRPTVNVQSADDIRMVPVGKSLMVSAPADKMAEIEELIAQVDVPADDDRDIRVYPFAKGIDVQGLAETMRQLFGGKTVVRGKKSARPLQIGGQGIIFVAQPRANKLLVSAPIERFEEIEENIKLLATESDDVAIIYDFIPTHEGNAATVVALIEPMLRAKISNLVDLGELPQPAVRKGKAGQQQFLTIQADPQGDRVIISAPPVVVAEARALILEIDRESDDGDRVVRTVLLQKTDPNEMTRTIQAMISSQKPRPVPRGGKKKKGVARTPQIQVIRGDELDVVVTPAPGGGAIVLAGAARDVETVEGWIKGLDEDAVGTGKIVKLYDLQMADVEQVADLLMAVVDTAARKAPGKAPKADDGGDSFFNMFSTEFKRIGKDLYISGNTLSNTMLVAATPAKMREVDELVARFVPKKSGEGPDIEPPKQILPYMTYELACTDAYDGAYALAGIINVLWPYEDKPQVESVPFVDNLLVVKGNPEHFGMVEDLIKEHVDKCGDGSAVTRGYLNTAGTGMTAKQGALTLMAQLQVMGYDVEVLSLEPEDPTELEEINPCYLPAAAFAPIRSALAAMGLDGPTESDASHNGADQEQDTQDPPAETVDPKNVLRDFAKAQQAAEKDTAKKPPAAKNAPAAQERPKLRIVFDNNTGQIVVEGASVAVNAAESLVASIKEELKDVTAPPEIRIFRLKHISVTKAADILEEMFNDRRRARQMQQLAAQQRRAQQQAEKQRRQQQAAAGKDQKGQRQPQPAQAQPPQLAGNVPAQMPQWNVTVYPNPRDRTLIIKAATEAFPRVINLLKKIDKDPKAPLDYKIFTLKNNVASDVEEQLNAMLGLNRTQTRRRPSGGARGSARAPGPTDDLLQMEMPGGSGAIAAEEITISSNPSTNSILVMAPKEAMELVERFIDDMEKLGKPQFVLREYELKHADVTEVVPQIEKFYKATQGRSAGKGAAEGFDPLVVNAPIFMADARTNTLIVRALEIDIPKIEPLILQLDVPYEEGAVQEYILIHANADQMASTLQKIYGAKAGGKAAGGKSVNIVGDADSNIIFVAAPPAIQREIAQRIESAERIAAGRMAPKVLTVQFGKASTIAEKISQALGAVGKSKGSLNIIGDDASKQLIVSAPDELIPQIQSLLTLLDKPPSGMDLRIYPLKHARAADVLAGMNEMVLKLKAQIGGKGIDLDIFSATADERSNSLVVMGGPTTFLVVEKVLKELDVEGQDFQQGAYRTFALQFTDAAEMVDILSEYMRPPSSAGSKRGGGAGQLRGDVRISAMEATNSLIVSGEASAIEHLAELIATLDVEVADSSAAPKIIQLVHAQASEIQPSLADLFAKKAGRKGSGGAAPPPVIVANDGSNTLLVRASAVDYSQIKHLVEQMDIEGAALTSSMKILTLNPGVNAVEMANNIDELLEQMVQYLPKPKGGQRPQRVLVRADTRSNSLILSGPQSKFAEVETLVRDLEKLGPSGGTVSKIIRVNNRDPQEIKALIEQIVNERKGGSSGSRPRRSPSRGRGRRR